MESAKKLTTEAWYFYIKTLDLEETPCSMRIDRIQNKAYRRYKRRQRVLESFGEVFKEVFNLP